MEPLQQPAKNAAGSTTWIANGIGLIWILMGVQNEMPFMPKAR